MVIKNNDERLQNIKICGVNNEIYGIDYVPSICNLNISIFGNNNKVYIPKDLKINKNGGGYLLI